MIPAKECEDIRIELRDDFVFAGRDDTFEAFNVSKGQMLCGLSPELGVRTSDRGYLATFTYHVSASAAGDFVIDFRYDESAGDQTFLVSFTNGRIAIGATTPSVLTAGAVGP